jgi:peptidoglycan/xylan/chitin deacetylase (PgdA/CDA1 family)
MLTSPAEWFPIIGYHQVVDRKPANDQFHLCTSRRRFERQMAWFHRLGYRSISLDAAAEHLLAGTPVPPRRFAITFDDGYKSVLTHALPVLQEFGFTATVFVVTGLAGGSSEWDRGLTQPAPLLDWSEIGLLAASGMSIGSHTVSHPHLSAAGSEQARREVSESKQTIETRLGMPVRSFCYPYGDCADWVEALVEDAGYDLACDDVGRGRHRRYVLSRIDPSYWPAALTPLLRSRRWIWRLQSLPTVRLARRVRRVGRSRATAARP